MGSDCRLGVMMIDEVILHESERFRKRIELNYGEIL